MLLSDLFKETYTAIFANKARTSLTILGIVIGIGSVVAMLSIGQGAKNTIEEGIQSIGSNLIFVYPGTQRGVGSPVQMSAGSAQTLDLDDARAIEEEIKNIDLVAPEVSRRLQIVTKGKNTNTTTTGISANYFTVRKIEVERGIDFSPQHINSNSKVVILGTETAANLFVKGIDPIGQKVRINQIDFKVIGILKEMGGGGFGVSKDDIAYVPITTAQRFLIGSEAVSTINIQVTNQKDMENVRTDVTELLLKRHNITNPELADFMVFSQADILDVASSITSTFTILLSAIASISLLVGGIGIMNMMLTNVAERTKEIGLRKSIGATRADINFQFLAESTLLTIAGGIIGIFFGWLVSFVLSQFTSLNASVSLSAVLLAFGVSAFIGIIFGYYPAVKASKLSPIEALRRQ